MPAFADPLLAPSNQWRRREKPVPTSSGTRTHFIAQGLSRVRAPLSRCERKPSTHVRGFQLGIAHERRQETHRLILRVTARDRDRVRYACEPRLRPQHLLRIRTPRLLAVLLSAAVAVPALANGFVWDDAALITQSSTIAAPLTTVLTAPFLYDPATRTAHYYRPVTQLWYALIHQIAGPAPLAFHLGSFVLHLVTVWLAIGWVERRLRLQPAAAEGDERTATEGNLRRLGQAAALGSLLFALHPTRPQSVAWVSGAGDLLCCLWFLLAAAAFDQRERQRSAGPLAALFCALAVLSKESGIVIPLVLAIDAALRARDAAARKQIAGASAWAFGGVAVALAVHAHFAPPIPRPELNLLAIPRVITSLGYAVSAVVWPWNPRFQLNVSAETLASYDPSIHFWFEFGALVLVAYATLCVYALRRRQLRPPLADLTVALLTLAPSLNLLPIGVGFTLSERYLTLPLLAVAALASRALLRLSARPVFVFAIAASTCGVLAFFNLRETRVLASERSLYEHFYAQDPQELSSLDRLLELRLRAGELLGARALSIARLQLIWNGGEAAAPSSLKSPQRSAECALALLSAVRFELLITSDEDQSRLAELRNLLDQFAANDATSVTLRLAGQDFALPIDAAAREAARRPTAAGDLREDRVLAHARTLDLPTAERLAREWLSPDPAAPRPRRLYVRTLLWQERWTDALHFVGPGDEALAIESAMHRIDAEGAASSSDRGSDRARLVRAEVLAGLGLPAAAQALIRDVQPNANRSRVAAAIALADKRPDRVRELGFPTPALTFARSSFADYERAAPIRARPALVAMPR
jgi:hypothetical protein